MLAVLLVLAIADPHWSPQQPPRDPRTAASVAVDPASAAGQIQLARQQEERGAVSDAELTLTKARAAFPSSREVVLALAGFYNRQGDFERTIATLEDAARLNPNDPQGYQIIATYYWEKAFRDQRLLPAERYNYVMQGIAATDRALDLNPEYTDALTYKNILLRMRANMEPDPAQKQQLIAEADALRNKAIELNKTRTALDGGNRAVALRTMSPPPPPPPPPPDGPAPVRVGGNIKAPTKVKDVRPIYPEDAKAAGIAGVVIIEAVISPDGHVGDARVLRSIPLLDDAAIEAVRQWEFTPTLVNGAPVPVIMTVTVNFTLQ